MFIFFIAPIRKILRSDKLTPHVKNAFPKRCALFATVMVALIVQTSLADDAPSAMINQQLDTRQDLDLSGTLPQAIDVIEKKTGVHIEVDPSVWALLPWGHATTVSAKIRNASLREALTAITSKLGLRFELAAQAVRLMPVAALQRLGRRANVAELDVLALLAHTPLNPASAQLSVDQLAQAIEHQLEANKSPFAVEDSADAATRATAVAVPNNATLFDALRMITQQTSASWYPSGKTLLIVPKRKIVERMLAQHISARYDGVDVPQVLLELFQRGNIPFKVEPGAFARLPKTHRAVHLMMQDASLRDALQAIAGETGLHFEPTDTGVYVWDKNPPPSPPPATMPTTLPNSGKPVKHTVLLKGHNKSGR